MRCLGDGETVSLTGTHSVTLTLTLTVSLTLTLTLTLTVSLTGTHLGHNLPDRNGNRYCINLVSVAGRPAAGAA